jgi:hypothetical protein
MVINGRAHDLQPFGANIISVQAHSVLADRPNTPPG